MSLSPTLPLQADHRVLLYCELTLFKEEEDLLLLARGQVYVR